MSLPEPPLPIRELTQTREFTRREKRQLMALGSKLAWHDLARTRDYVWSYLWMGFGAFLALTILLAANRLASSNPNLAAQLSFAGAGYFVAFLLAQWRGNRLQEEKYWAGQRRGDRFVIEPDHFVASAAHGSFRCDWATISALSQSGQFLVMTLPNGGAFLLAKAAFEGQDVAGFCDELERRWKQAQARPA